MSRLATTTRRARTPAASSAAFAGLHAPRRAARELLCSPPHRLPMEKPAPSPTSPLLDQVQLLSLLARLSSYLEPINSTDRSLSPAIHRRTSFFYSGDLCPPPTHHHRPPPTILTP